MVERSIVGVANTAQPEQVEVDEMIVLLIVVLLALAVWRFGTDSRDGRDWMPRSL